MRYSLAHRSQKFVAGLWIGWLSFGGCTFGPSVSNHSPATSGAGLSVVVTLQAPLTYGGSSSLRGELLSVSEQGLTLLLQSVKERLVLVPFAVVRESSSPQDRSASIGRSGVTPETYERLRLQSRFPQGLSGDVLRRMLELHGQKELNVAGDENA